MVWDSSLVCDADMRPIYLQHQHCQKLISTNMTHKMHERLWVSGLRVSDWNTDNLLLLVNERPTNIFQKLWAEDTVCMCSVGECLIRVNLMNLFFFFFSWKLVGCLYSVVSTLIPFWVQLGVRQHTEEPLDWRIGVNGQSVQERIYAWEDTLSDDGITVLNLILS